MGYLINAIESYINNGRIYVSLIVVLSVFVIDYMILHCKKDVHPQILFKYSFLAVYVYLILEITVLSREVRDDYYFLPQLFWTYRMIGYGYVSLIYEAVWNIIMFIPMGIVLTTGKSRYIFIKIILEAFVFVIAVESLQLYLNRGIFETDDIFHALVGTSIGYLIVKAANRIRNKNTEVK